MMNKTYSLMYKHSHESEKTLIFFQNIILHNNKIIEPSFPLFRIETNTLMKENWIVIWSTTTYFKSNLNLANPTWGVAL